VDERRLASRCCQRARALAQIRDLDPNVELLGGYVPQVRQLARSVLQNDDALAAAKPIAR
jgi:hypothetical protein